MSGGLEGLDEGDDCLAVVDHLEVEDLVLDHLLTFSREGLALYNFANKSWAISVAGVVALIDFTVVTLAHEAVCLDGEVTDLSDVGDTLDQ